MLRASSRFQQAAKASHAGHNQPRVPAPLQYDMSSFHRPRALLLPAIVSCACYAAVTWLSRQFVYGEQYAQRPILEVLGLLGVAFVCYLAALAIALRCPNDRWLLAWIIVPAVLFRAVLLPSQPIQEVDIYRYMWDGATTVSGVSPFRYSPEQVLEADGQQPLPDDLTRLVELRDRSPAVAAVLRRVHFPELPTIYPPVSQAVFHLATRTTPADANLHQRVVVMKAWFMALDIATIWVVVRLVQLAGLPWGWSLTYAWCPLVMKEIANSGHLDVIAVLLTVLALYVAVRTWARPENFRSAPGTMLATVAAAVLLGLAVGAKLYPIVLVPLVGLVCARRVGGAATVLAASAFTVTAALVLWPMLPPRESLESYAARNAPHAPSESPPLSPEASIAQDPSAGLQAFLSRWEMNDFIFLLVFENLRPQHGKPPSERPWFLVLPESSRAQALSAVAWWEPDDPSVQAFFLARVLTLGLFAALALWFAWQASRSTDARDWLGAAFLTLAWFWILSPTQNPWYWIWALPLLPFARSRIWLLVSGLVLIYYLRFWFTYHFAETAVPGTDYTGPVFFDFIVTWLQHVPLLALLAVETGLRRWRRGSRTTI